MSFDITDPTLRNYKFNARVEVKKIHVVDVVPGSGVKEFDREVCVLVPCESDQRTSFLNAWLPETSGEYFEIAMILGSPISSPCRGAIRRANEVCSDHHIYVMSKGVEEELIRYGMDNKRLVVEVLPANHEELAEQAPDSDGDYDVLV